MTTVPDALNVHEQPAQHRSTHGSDTPGRDRDVAMLTIGPNDLVLAANAAACELLDRSSRQVVGVDGSELLTLDLERAREILIASRRRDPSHRHIEGLTEVWRPDGRQLFVVARIRAVGSSDRPEDSLVIEMAAAPTAHHDRHDASRPGPSPTDGSGRRAAGSLGTLRCRLDGTVADADRAATATVDMGREAIIGQSVETVVSFEPLHIDEIWSAAIRHDSILDIDATVLLASGLLPVVARAYATHELDAPVAIELFTPSPTERSLP